MQEVLGDFIHGCSPDPSARTAAVTTLVISLWQVAGRGMSHRLPSLVLLNAQGASPDPVDTVAAQIANDSGAPGPGMRREGAFMCGKPEEAPQAMASAILEKHRMGSPQPYNLQIHQMLEDRFFAAQATGFGAGRTRPYSKAWHETFDLLTDRNDELILRFEGEDDCMELRRHLLEDPAKLQRPTGYGAGLVSVEKRIAISGSLAAGQWDAEIAMKLVEQGLPLVFLPHAVKEPLVTKNLPVLQLLTRLLSKAYDSPLEEPANLPPDKWCEHYGKLLRLRLRELPDTFEYAMQRAVRQLFPVCNRIAVFSGRLSGASTAEVEALLLDLYKHTLRGMVIGVTGLAWHGVGFATDVSRSELLKVLKYLRDGGPMTKSNLTRHGKVPAAKRDAMLELFAAEGLVRVDGKMVAATTYPEFVAALCDRKEFPTPENHWAQVAKAAAPAA